MPVTLALTISGTNRLSYLAPSGVQLTDTLTGPSQLRMEMHDASGAWTPSIGQVVILSVGGSPVFKGHIYDLTTTLTEGHATLLRHHVVCQDLSHLPYRRLITGTWDETMYYGSELGSELDFELGSYVTGQTYGEIVRAIVEAYLGDDGITVDATSCPNGSTATRFSFNLARLSDAFDALAEAAGVYWWIDAAGQFYFKASTSAPFSLTGGGGSSNCRNISLRRTASQYRNRQYVRGGMATISAVVEDYLGDGSRSTLTTTYGIQRIIEFTVNGIAQSYGVRGVDTGMAWGYQVGGTDLGLESRGGGTVPANGAAIRLVYDGQYPLTVRKSDSAEISARATAEGTTGVWEAIEDATNLDGESRIETRADELLRRYAVIDKRVTLETDTDGLAAGQVATLTVSALGLSGSSWLIEEVRAQSVEGQLLRYTVTLTDGEIQAVEKRALKGTRAPQLGYDRRTGEALSIIS